MAEHHHLTAYERALQIIQRHQLTERLPHLALTIAIADAAKGRPLATRHQQLVIETVAAWEQGRREHSFLPRRNQFLGGTFAPFSEAHTGTPVWFVPEDLASHALIAGASGSTKTAGAQTLVTNLQRAHHDVDVCYLDPKGNDWQAHAITDTRCLPITEDTPLCPTVPPPFMRTELFDQLVAKTFAESFFGASHTVRVFVEGTRQARTRHPNGHSLAELAVAIANPPKKDFTFQDRDTRKYVLGQLDLIRAALPGCFHAKPPRCITWENLCTNPVYWPLRSRLSAFEFFIALWTNLRMEYHRHEHHHDLHTLFVMDEGLQLWQTDARHHISGTPLLDHAVSQTRALGFGFLITTTSLRQVSPMVRANTNLQLILRLVDGIEVDDARRTLGLDEEQTFYLRNGILRGQGIMRLSHKYPEPLLITFPRPELPRYTTAQWYEAMKRYEQHLPSHRPLIEISTAEPAETPSRVPLLNDRETAFLRRLATGPLVPVSELYAELQLHSSAGDHIKRHLLKLGLITAEDVKLHTKRGRPGVILADTEDGLQALGIKRTRPSSRGGSLAHTYYCQELATLVGGEREVSVAIDDDHRKCVDVFFRYEHERHERFLLAMAQHCTRLFDAPFPFDGTIAIEVDLHTNTIANNLRKDRKAGISLVIVAILEPITPLLVEQLRKEVPKEDWPQVFLVNVVTLLDACRAVAKESLA